MINKRQFIFRQTLFFERLNNLEKKDNQISHREGNRNKELFFKKEKNSFLSVHDMKKSKFWIDKWTHKLLKFDHILVWFGKELDNLRWNAGF